MNYVSRRPRMHRFATNRWLSAHNWQDKVAAMSAHLQIPLLQLVMKDVGSFCGNAGLVFYLEHYLIVPGNLPGGPANFADQGSGHGRVC